MLHEFLVTHRNAIISGAQARVAARAGPQANALDLTNGISVFLDQLGVALRLARSSDVVDHEQIDRSAGEHGADLLQLGLTIGQVVHDYGDICQTITELVVELSSPISGEEFGTLNLCLDDAIAGAVTEYARQHEANVLSQGTERLGVLAHELRNSLNTAMLAFDMIRSGRVAPGGSTGVVMTRSLLSLRDLIDRSLAEVRLEARIDRVDSISVAEFLDEIEIGASLQSRARNVQVTIAPVAREARVDGDRQILAAAIANLLNNAFKFTRTNGHVVLRTLLTPERVLFEIEDECGGLPPGEVEELFRPYHLGGADLTGVGLGLSICLKAAKANGGDVRVRDLPGKGCVFVLDLPRTDRVEERTVDPS